MATKENTKRGIPIIKQSLLYLEVLEKQSLHVMRRPGGRTKGASSTKQLQAETEGGLVDKCFHWEPVKVYKQNM